MSNYADRGKALEALDLLERRGCGCKCGACGDKREAVATIRKALQDEPCSCAHDARAECSECDFTGRSLRSIEDDLHAIRDTAVKSDVKRWAKHALLKIGHFRDRLSAEEGGGDDHRSVAADDAMHASGDSAPANPGSDGWLARRLEDNARLVEGRVERLSQHERRIVADDMRDAAFRLVRGVG